MKRIAESIQASRSDILVRKNKNQLSVTGYSNPDNVKLLPLIRKIVDEHIILWISLCSFFSE